MKKLANRLAVNVPVNASRGKPRRPAPSRSQLASESLASAVASGSGRVAGLPGPRWTFLTNHSHVLILISRNPNVVLRQVAIEVGITERAVQRIIADLEEAGILEREKVGRQNRYRILNDQPLRHSVESHQTIGNLLSLMENGLRARSAR